MCILCDWWEKKCEKNWENFVFSVVLVEVYCDCGRCSAQLVGGATGRWPRRQYSTVQTTPLCPVAAQHFCPIKTRLERCFSRNIWKHRSATFFPAHIWFYCQSYLWKPPQCWFWPTLGPTYEFSTSVRPVKVVTLLQVDNWRLLLRIPRRWSHYF